MASDTQAILDEAEKIGELVKNHPSYEKYRAAAKTVGEDPEAGRLVNDFNRQLETLMRQEQSGMPVTDAQHQQLEALQQRIASGPSISGASLSYSDSQKSAVRLFRSRARCQARSARRAV